MTIFPNKHAYHIKKQCSQPHNADVDFGHPGWCRVQSVGFGLDDHAGNQAAEPQGGAVASYVWFFRVPWLQILYPQLVASVTHPVVPQMPIPSYTYNDML